ncbi:unnamed protein product [Oikopleura dioica]|uniref:Protein kinase domain-containing protein n=1 Tax=Oikopleura dioica TaxID=34765 RepID=E4XW00_OIKDI|nr:unnamed protein product [Oikopleura dioica]
MLTEFALLTALTLNSDEREVLRDKIDEWVKLFLPKLERESTRTEKCRLIASVERHEFEDDSNAADWRFCKFVGKNGIIFNEDKRQIQKFKATSFQKRILRRNPNLSDIFIGRSEIKEENGIWNFKNELKDELLSERGEAIVFSQKFGENLMAVRIAVFDPFLFTKQFGAGQIKWRTNLISDFETATKDEEDDALVVPVHKNIIRNFANIEIFDSGDEEEEDSLGWITIMEKCDGNLREKLKNGNPTLDERIKIATGIKSGLKYLEKVGIKHSDKKLANFLLIGDVAKVCDFGLVSELSERKSYRKLGYTRRGSKYKNGSALFAGTPGFTGQNQLGGMGAGQNDYFLYLFCDWKTIWSLNYRPIDDQEKNEIDKIILNCGVQNINKEDHVISNFKTATNDERDDALVVPVHDNVIRNFANIEIFDSGDAEEEDCLGWITIMEKCDGNLRETLKNGSPNLDERKKIAIGIKSGLDYLREVGIYHFDKKLANFLLIGDVAKVCDFGLVWEFSGRKSYRKLGYTRRGAKYKNGSALFAGTPGFAEQWQLGGVGDANHDYFLYLFCDWKTIWSLNYRPIDDQEKNEIDKIILV